MNSSRPILILAATFLVALLPDAALAYIGPGAGLSAIGTAIAVIGAFVLLIVGFIWYPVKRLLRGRKKAPAQGVGSSSDNQS